MFPLTNEGFPSERKPNTENETIQTRRTISFFQSMRGRKLLHLGNDSLECFGVVHGQVGEYLAVNLDAGLV